MERMSYMHIPIGNGRATLAIRTNESSFVWVGVALCSPRDHFARAKGRKIAERRVTSPGSDFSFFMTLEDFKDLKNKVSMEFISRCKAGKITPTASRKVPCWVSRSIKRLSV